jgi:hypothetical protein
MKVILNFFILLVCFTYANAQSESSLPVDERGKLIYYEVVNLKDVSKDSLKTRTLDYIKKNSTLLKFEKIVGDTAFFAIGKMIISKTVLVMSHPSGEIMYDFQVELKQGKYRFWLTNFSFIPYQRDRYGNFVPNTTIGIPLENESGKLNATQWKEYKTQTTAFAKDFAAKFKAYMASKAPVVAPAQEKNVVSKTW